MEQSDLAGSAESTSVAAMANAHPAADRGRWAGAFLGSAAVLGSGSYLWSGYELLGSAGVGVAIQVLALIFAALGILSGIAALMAFRGRACASTAVGDVRITAGESAAGNGVAGKSAARKGAFRSRQLSGPERLGLAVPFAALVLATVGVGVLHITVWNPMARVPGLTLDEIYGRMAAANESPLVASIVAWAVVWGGASLTFLVLAGTPRYSPLSSARRIIVTGLLLHWATATLFWFAGFNMGMSLADTFMTSGGDAAASGPIIAIVSQFALVAALLVGLAPPARRKR